MWGVMAGLILKSERTELLKMKILVIAGLIGVVLWYALNPITPIITRICTTSFVIVSGGLVLLTLADLYYMVDVKKIQKFPRFLQLSG